MSSWLKRQLNTFEHYPIDVIFGRREGVRATVFAGFLQGMSYLFSGIAQARNAGVTPWPLASM
jgi:tetraacyldisaccharide 4'-kinase